MQGEVKGRKVSGCSISGEITGRETQLDKGKQGAKSSRNEKDDRMVEARSK